MQLLCKNCGNELVFDDGQKITVCDFCGMEQTLPTANDPQKLKLFAKANEHRFASRFDIAKKQYENIIAQYPDDNEAYWCKLLCVYGIEYVDDILTEKKLPTCHRTVTESIFDNKDYKLIMSRATEEEKAIYEAEAKEIDRIQKEILAKADKEEPYDIFICYKDADENAKKTTDYHLASKLYSHFTNLGYKVFFSAATLRNRGGEEYEPIIYSALHSSKVMLLVSANKDYVNAPWVRNEWSRFLDLRNSDYTKALVPCLKGVNPDDLSDELSKLQVLDINEIDFYENLTRLIDSKFEKRTQVSSGDNRRGEIIGYLNRAKKCVEDRDWQKALECAENCLNIDAECGEAYFICLLCSYKASNIEELAKQSGVLDNTNYKRAMQYASPTLKIQLDDIARIFYYERAQAYMNSDLTLIETYEMVKSCLQKAAGYKDADELLMKLSSIRAEQFAKKSLLEKEENYNLALQFLNSDLTIDETYATARKYLELAIGYKDAAQLLASLPSKRKEQLHYRQLIEKQRERDFKAEQKRKRAEEKKRQKEIVKKERAEDRARKKNEQDNNTDKNGTAKFAFNAIKVSFIVGVSCLALITGVIFLFQLKAEWNVVQWLISVFGGVWLMVSCIVISIYSCVKTEDGSDLKVSTVLVVALSLINFLLHCFIGEGYAVIAFGISIALTIPAIVNSICAGWDNKVHSLWEIISCLTNIIVAVTVLRIVCDIGDGIVIEWMFLVFGGIALASLLFCVNNFIVTTNETLLFISGIISLLLVAFNILSIIVFPTLATINSGFTVVGMICCIVNAMPGFAAENTAGGVCAGLSIISAISFFVLFLFMSVAISFVDQFAYTPLYQQHIRQLFGWLF